MHRIISEVRPRYALIENVPMLIHRGIERVLCDLTEIGYDCEWQIIGADEVGAWHRRKRIWIVAYPGNSANRANKRKKSKKDKISEKHRKKRLAGFISGASGSKKISSKNVSNTNSSGHIYRQIKEQPTEGRLDAFSESEPSGTHEKYVSYEKPARYWNAEPDVGRVANGIPDRVDRLTGLGNAIVPQVAHEIMKRIKQEETT